MTLTISLPRLANKENGGKALLVPYSLSGNTLAAPAKGAAPAKEEKKK